MKLYNLLFLILFLTFSCSTKKDIVFVQDLDKFEINGKSIGYKDISIKNDDILKIDIYTQSKELSDVFNISSVSSSVSTLESYQLNGYQVNSKGYINFPILGSIKVKDKTTDEISSFIKSILVDKGILINPTVDVRIVNAYFTILGEVKMPGRYNFIKNNIDIFQAIGMAGDLTINGKRDDVKILRNSDGILEVSSLDLTSSAFLFSDNFQILSGDVIIVNPNSSRIKTAGAIGSTVIC